MALRTELSATMFTILGIVSKMASTLLNKFLMSQNETHLAFFVSLQLLQQFHFIDRHHLEGCSDIRPCRMTRHASIALTAPFLDILLCAASCQADWCENDPFIFARSCAILVHTIVAILVLVVQIVLVQLR